MTEGQTYRCSWRQLPDGSFELWVVRRPKLRVVAVTSKGAFDALAERVHEELGDWEAEFDFDPPLPTVPLASGIDKTNYVTVWPGGGLQIGNPPQTLFSGLDCRVCGYNQPALRTEHPLLAEPTADSAIGSVEPRDGWCMTLGQSLIEHLTLDQRQTFTQRPVVLPARSRRKCVEIVPHRFVPRCGVRDVQVTMGVRCESCGFKTFAHGNSIDWLTSVCRSDLPVPIPDLFFAGDFSLYDLCLSRTRWSALKRLPGMSQWTSKPLLIVNEADCLRDPPLPSVAEQEAWTKRTGRGFSYVQWIDERPT